MLPWKKAHGVAQLLDLSGVSDREEEVEAMVEFLCRQPVHLVQLRNLNIDPDVYLKSIPLRRGRLLGIRGCVLVLRLSFLT